MNRKIISEACTENSPLKVFGSTNCVPGCGELGAHQHRHQAADDEEEEGRADVLDADDLVVGVDAEVVAPRCRRRGPSGPPGSVGRAGGPAEPVVEAADPDQEAERGGDQGADGDDRVPVDRRVPAVERRGPATTMPVPSAEARAPCRGRRGTSRVRVSLWRERHPCAFRRYFTSASSSLLRELVLEVLGHDVRLEPLGDVGVRVDDRGADEGGVHVGRSLPRSGPTFAGGARLRQRVAAQQPSEVKTCSASAPAACRAAAAAAGRGAAARGLLLLLDPGLELARRRPRARTGASWSGRCRTARRRPPRSCRSLSGVTRILVVRPGTASDFSRNCGTQNEWSTSFVWIRELDRPVHRAAPARSASSFSARVLEGPGELLAGHVHDHLVRLLAPRCRRA